jgi:molybdenum cofactor synthesis domain-containing protein|tara:strand:+ start:380 stop:1132 length:753 start_codon:yes stop_codon:yes gene_type:complete
MKKIKKINAAIIVIGNEILSGRTQDVNVINISHWLNGLGVKLEEVRVIPDIEITIVQTIREVRKKFTYVFTTGGIGPTHDDITAKSIAKSFKVKYCYHPEAYKILENYYKKGKFNIGRKKMAKTPKNASLIYNPSSAAPGFNIKNVYCLPGVPSILRSMLGGLNNKIIGGNKISSKTLSLRTVESEIAIPLEKIQNKFKKLDIGSYPFFKQGKVGVSLVMRSSNLKLIDKCMIDIIKFIKIKKIKIITNS